MARTGRPATGSFEVDELVRFATLRRHATVLRRLSPGPYVIVPLRVGGRQLGTLTMVRSTGSDTFTPRERALVDELADRASLALAHARDFDEQRTAALTFQRILLPASLETFPGIGLAVRYRAAARGSEVGGDWYDVITLPGDAVGLVIGDVEGHDVSAAALMGQVRSVVGAYAQEGHPPAAVAEKANAFLRRAGASRLVTMLYLQLDPGTRLLTSVRVGHLPALVVAPGGPAHELSTPAGPPLGVHDHAQWPEETVHLAQGSVLALFTDGLVEEPGASLETGLGRLARAMGGLGDSNLEAAADLLIAGALAPGDHLDDFALLLVRLPAHAEGHRGPEQATVAAPGPANPPSAGAGGVPPAHAARRRLPSMPSSSPAARHFVRASCDNGEQALRSPVRLNCSRPSS